MSEFRPAVAVIWLASVTINRLPHELHVCYLIKAKKLSTACMKKY